MHSPGFDIIEPSFTGLRNGGCGTGISISISISTCTDSTFSVTLLTSASVVAGSFSFNAPDDVAAFVGVIRGEAISVREARRRAKGMARVMIVELTHTRAIDASQSTDPLRYTNHSCQPNAVLRIRQGRVEFYAMRDVPLGAELTVNYGETHHEGTLRCRCGAAGCVGML